MTADEFEVAYAERSGVTVDFLHSWGRYAEPCSCGEEGCEGWAMGNQHDDALFEEWRRAGCPPFESADPQSDAEK